VTRRRKKSHKHAHRAPSASGAPRPAPVGASWKDLPARPGRRAAAACALLAIAAGVLWDIASKPIDLWPLGWIALAPAIWLVDRAATARHAGLWGWLAGASATVGGFHWIAGLLIHQAGMPFVVGWLGVLLLGAYQGLALLLAARAMRALRKRGWPLAIAAPLAVVTGEMVLPVIFPYYLAITQASATPVIQLAELTGPVGVTALLAAVSGALVELIDRRRWRPAAITAGAVAVVVGGGLLRMHQIDGRRAAAPHVKVGLISEGVPSQTTGGPDRAGRLENLRALQAASARAEADGAQLIVWTETGYPFDLPRDLDHDLADSPYTIRRGFSAPLVFGALTFDRAAGGAPWNSATLLDRDGRFVARHDKLHRVLGSEYNPLVETFPSLERFMPAGAGHFAAGERAVILPAAVGDRTVRLGPMICFEDILPGHGREVAALDPNLLVNVTNDSWFGPVEPWQHLALAVFRAVEIRADMVRAVNTGPSTHVDAAGRLIAKGAQDRRGPEALVVDAAILEGGGTVFAKVGNVFGWICVAVTLGLWLGPVLLRRRRGIR